MSIKNLIYMKSRTLTLVGLLTAMFAGILSSATASDRFPNPSAPDFPIAAWKTFTVNTVPTDQEFSWVKEARINIVSEAIRDSAMISKVASKVADHNLKLVFASDYIGNINHVPSIVNRFKGHPGVLGYMIKDEPKVTDFQFCADRNEIIRNLDPQALGYVNLWPATNDFSNDYSKYLDDFIALVKPKVLSVDIYPIRSEPDSTFHTYTRYYETYEILNKKSKQYNLPWMACIASTDINDIKKPDLSNMRFATFTALAYGVQGICWWTYQLPPNTENTTFLNAPIVNGKRTQAWYDMKKINEEIQRYKDVFLDCKIVGVALVDTVRSSSSSYKVNRINTTPLYMPLDGGQTLEVHWIGQNTAYTKGYVVSQIRNNGHEYLVIVSQDWEHHQYIRFKLKGTCIFMNPDGTETELQPPYYVKKVPAGGYLILRLS